MTDWTQSEKRVQIHEIGHGVVDFLGSGVATDRYVFKIDGQFVGQASGITGGKSAGDMTRAELLVAVASFWGGWAAVNLAIVGGHLPAEPEGVEATPGDRGFLGGEGSDSDWVRRFSMVGDPEDPEAFSSEARCLALEMLTDRIPLVVQLADEMDGMGFLSAERLQEALSPLSNENEDEGSI